MHPIVPERGTDVRLACAASAAKSIGCVGISLLARCAACFESGGVIPAGDSSKVRPRSYAGLGGGTGFVGGGRSSPVGASRTPAASAAVTTPLGFEMVRGTVTVIWLE